MQEDEHTAVLIVAQQGVRHCLQFTKPHRVQVFLGVGSSGNRCLYSNEGSAAVYNLLPTALCLKSETKLAVLMFCASNAQESERGTAVAANRHGEFDMIQRHSLLLLFFVFDYAARPT